jgi:protein tyrosine/serine phosphatase
MRFCLSVALVVLAASAAFAADRPGRPPTWAVAPPEAISGLPNFHRVTPDLYRGAQPTAEGMRRLEAMGIRTVVSLRAFNDDESLLPQTALAHPRIRFKTWHPEDEDVVRFLRIVADPANAPVFVHCQHGSDRTGTMIAIYRIAVQGWSKEEAIREMVEGGYGFHPMWENLKTYIRGLDIDAIRREAGLR